jgi:murein DD-endopeptidase MepM/ murein hydrolase activator NlpD
MRRAGRARRARVRPLVAIILSFLAGVFVDGWLRTYGPPRPAEPLLEAGAPAVAPPSTVSAPAPSSRVSAPVATSGTVVRHKLRVPIDGSDPEKWKGSFDERRSGGSRGHDAVDILSPRNTPVHAADSGTIAKIFESKQGGHTVYQFSADGQLVYYYAHLERYADGLHEGQSISPGDVIGYVGTSGNAPPNTPHLHFAIFELGPDKRWWRGQAVDPYLVFTKGLGK